MEVWHGLRERSREATVAVARATAQARAVLRAGSALEGEHLCCSLAGSVNTERRNE